MPETATWAYILRARGAGDRVANSEDGCHAKMEANAPSQPLPAGHGHRAAEDSRAGRGDHPDRVQRRVGLPFRLLPVRILLAGPNFAPRRRADTAAVNIGSASRIRSVGIAFGDPAERFLL